MGVRADGASFFTSSGGPLVSAVVVVDASCVGAGSGASVLVAAAGVVEEGGGAIDPDAEDVVPLGVSFGLVRFGKGEVGNEGGAWERVGDWGSGICLTRLDAVDDADSGGFCLAFDTDTSILALGDA